MGYKVLGYVVWHGGKIYLRRRYGPAVKTAVLTGVAGGVIAALVVVGARQRNA